MQGSNLLLIIDVAGLCEPAQVILRILLVARILAASRKAADALAWRYRLVNLSVASTTFQAALHDACKASLTGWEPVLGFVCMQPRMFRMKATPERIHRCQQSPLLSGRTYPLQLYDV